MGFSFRVRGPWALVGFVALVLSVPSAWADHPGTNLGPPPDRGIGPLAPVGGERFVFRYPDVDLAMGAWEATHPDFVDRWAIGASTGGFQLFTVRLTDERVPYDAADLATGIKLRVYLDGSHHGNEYLGTDLIMYYLDGLLAKVAAGDAETLAFLAKTEIYSTPLVNPEGNTADTRKNGRQVDLNRNYPYEWGGPGSGGSPASLTYRGPEPLSEPESKANAAFGASIYPDLWVTTHTGVAEFYWPWGWTDDPTPDDAFFTSLEGPFEKATNGRVDAMQAAELYLAAGATDDYGYGTFGIPTFTYEVHEDQFLPAYGEPISEVIHDQLAGLDFMVRNVRHMGAWIEPHLDEAGVLTLTNEGWGTTADIEVAIADELLRVPEILPGDTRTVPIPGAGGEAVLRYSVMLIETSKARTITVPLGAETLDVEDAPELPFVGVELLAAAVWGVVALWRRRVA